MFLPAMPVVKEDFGIGNELAFATLPLTMMTMAFATLVNGAAIQIYDQLCAGAQG